MDVANFAQEVASNFHGVDYFITAMVKETEDGQTLRIDVEQVAVYAWGCTIQ